MGFMDSFKAKSEAPAADKTPGTVVAIGVGKPGASDQPGDQGALNPAESAASDACMTALQSGDKAAFGRALKAFVTSCGGYGDSDSDADDAPAAKPPMPGMK